MSKIVLGESAGKEVKLDLDILLRTRLLIQANSGKGKSWLLRRLAEQLFGKVQVIILDPEGEFATLREKFAYVLVGKGGETAAHPKIAAMTAQRLLELKACAVCDLYEMKPSERHSYVRQFLDAMIDAPKNLWHPVVVILDEAHVYCPEAKAGESEATEAVISMATRGRKRGYCLIAATQRLGKLKKDAAAELNNVAIGGTFIDIDRKRAADTLGVYGQKETAEFFNEIRILERGRFYCLGPAVSNERVLVTVGGVETTHVEAGTGKHAAGPPPTPDSIQALLPKLADLPKEAEERAQTVAGLQTEVRSLKAKLRAAETTNPVPPPNVKADTKAIARLIAQASLPLVRQAERWRREMVRVVDSFGKIAAVVAALKDLTSEEIARPAGSAVPGPTGDVGQAVGSRLHSLPVASNAQPLSREGVAGNAALERGRVSSSPTATANGITTPMQRILDACAWMESIGVNEPKTAAVAFLAGYTVGGGAFNNPRGALRTAGLIEYKNDAIVLTDAGRQYANTPGEALTQDELHNRVLAQLPTPEQKILRVLLEKYPEEISNDELASASGYAGGGGAFNKPRGRLRSLGLAEYPQKGYVKAASLLFID